MQIRNSYVSPFLARDLSCAGNGLFLFLGNGIQLEEYQPWKVTT